MSYVALYRAYRPQAFKEVSGQEHIVKTLQNAIINKKVAHAYLFSGPRGTGKTTIAKIMAKAINCPNSVNGEPCNECEICKGITRGMIPDVVEIDAASNNGVDEIREIRDKVKYLPAEGKYKVYIIDEVHMLSTGAFNALLKTLEEPPAHAIFILATTEAQKIPATILSRCQRFDFRGIDEKQIQERIHYIAKSENIEVDEDAVKLISDCAEGGMRDALSLLDEAISFAGKRVSANDVYQVSGSVNYENIIKLATSVYEKDPAQSLANLEEIIDLGKEIPKICTDLIAFYRDMLLFKNNPRDNANFKDDFKALAKKISNAKIYFYLTTLNEAQNNMKFTNQKRTFLELALVKMSDFNETMNIDSRDEILRLERKIQVLENKLANGNFNIQKELPKIFEEPTEQPVVPQKNDNFVYVTTKDIADVLNNGNKSKRQQLAQKLLDVQATINDRALVMSLKGVSVVAVSNVAVFVFNKLSVCDSMMKSENKEKVLEAINQGDKLIDDYYAIPDDCWKLISDDYLTQYKAGNKKPILKEVNINVRIYSKQEVIKVPTEMEEIGKEFFGDKVKFID